ncbi:MAG: HAD family phosphatase [Chloroflexi bacterium]|nr:HAD family phosphatase [Chloroflexota bacterium]
MTTAHFPEPKGVVLDLDGTLVDTVKTRIDAWLQTFEEEGIPADRSIVAELIGSDGRQLARIVSDTAGAQLDDDGAERIDARSGAIYSRLNLDPQLLPGVTAFLDALDERKLPWAIATSSRREQVGRSVAALHRNEPPLIADGTRVKLAKPHPDLLLAAAGALEVHSAECWAVGDSTWDMVAAEAAGMVAIGITAGSAMSPDQLRAAGAALVFPTMDRLIPHLKAES